MEEQNQTPQAPKKSLKPIVIIVVLLLIIGGYVFSKGVMKQEVKDKELNKTEMQDEDGDEQEVPVTATPKSTTTPEVVTSNSAPTTTNTGALKTFTVKGNNFSFSPSEIKVNKGDKVKITFENTSGFHDFVIDEFNIRTQQISGGASETVEFTVDKQGTFEYYCSVGKHRAMGMKGNLIVQ